VKTAFFHDHRLRRDAAGAYFSNGGLPYAVLARYLKHFDGLVLVTRVQQTAEDESRERLSPAGGPRVEVVPVEGASRIGMLLGSAVKTHVRSVLQRVDCAIIRLPSLIGLAACREAITLGKPWMVEVVGCAWDSLWNYGSIAGHVSAPILYALNRHFIKRAPMALYVTEHFLQHRYPCGGPSEGCSDVVIPSPGDDVLAQRLRRIRESSDRRQVRIGLVGSLNVDYKGHETALRALVQLVPENPGLTLSLLGSGDAERWRRLASRLRVSTHVEFVGTLPSGGPVAQWMDGLDLYMIPSLQEGLPRALVEAMSRGLPAVGARTGGIPELIDARHIHDRKNHNQLALAIRRLIGSTAEMESAARANVATSRKYAPAILENRRDEFLARFRSYAERTQCSQLPEGRAEIQ